MAKNNTSIALVNQSVVDEIHDKLVDPNLTARDMIDLVTAAIKSKIPAPPEMSDNEQLVYNAAIADMAAVQLARLGESLGKAVRLAVYNMRYTGAFMHVPLDITDITGERKLDPVSGEIINSYYEGFDAWYESFAARADLNEEYRYTIYNGVTRLLGAVRDGQFYQEIPNEDGTTTKHIYCADEVMDLDVSKFKAMVTVANQTLGKLGVDPKVTAQAGEVMGAALNPKTSKRALAGMLVTIGVSTPRSELIQVEEIAAPGGGYWYLVRPANEKQANKFASITDGRIDKRIATKDEVAELLGILPRYVDEDIDVDEDALNYPDEDDITGEEDSDPEQIDPEELSVWLSQSYQKERQENSEQHDDNNSDYGF